MKIDVRVFIAVVLSFVVLATWGAYINKAECFNGAQQKEISADKNRVFHNVPEKPPEIAPPSFPDIKIVKSGEIKDIFIETALHKIVLTNEGASFKSLKLKKYLNKNTQPLELVAQNENSLRPLYISASDPQITDVMNLSLYTTARQGAETTILLSAQNPQKTVSFTLETPSGLRVSKDFTFYYDRYQIDLEVRISDKNVRLADKKYYINWGPGFGNEKIKSRYLFTGPVYYLNDEAIKYSLDKGREEFIFSGDLSWVCLQNKYFTSALIPGDGMNTGRIGKNRNDEISVGLKLMNNSDNSLTGKISLFAGPKEDKLLRAYNIHLDETIVFSWIGNKLSFLVRPFLRTLHFFYSFTHNYGVSIILITLILKILFFPLSQKSFKSMKKMNEVQPYIKIIREKYKDDKAILNQEMMKLYKEHKINPLVGFMPTLVQIPVFIALYNVLLVSIDLRGAPFILWIHDLSEKDPYYITPLLMGISMLIQQKMIPSVKSPVRAKITTFLPAIFTVMFLNFPAGLVIYWLVNNMLTIAQQYYINNCVVVKNS